ncbi:calmin isoform X2 [Betta splendens]|uniref:Calmin n=1 Tax=Betta splendens TaxID=158456 RepID=A0A9W2XI67_BETSP|nr:calmin isoform X2 [Betta splendens]
MSECPSWQILLEQRERGRGEGSGGTEREGGGREGGHCIGSIPPRKYQPGAAASSSLVSLRILLSSIVLPAAQRRDDAAANGSHPICCGSSRWATFRIAWLPSVRPDNSSSRLPAQCPAGLQMAGHEWEDWFEREELIGQISDIRVQNLQVERELVQKRTFTRWINLHLEKCNPPIEVHDLFRDIQDGRILMALLEELSGCKLLHGFKKSSHRIFRLNNIAKVLSFLEERNVKLISIDAVDVADGNASIILGLIWNIILFFQIKELTGNIRSQFTSSSSLSSIPTSADTDTSHCSSPSDDRQPPSTAMREHGKAIKTLLQWVQKRTRKYGVAVQDFGKSWTSGLAFLAVIKSIDPSLVDMRKALLRSPRENMEDAFRIAHYSLGIPRLLEPEDVTNHAPDEQCIMTYVSQFLEHFPGLEEEEPSLLTKRAVSMGRLNFRDSDYRMRNGADRRRVRERSYMFQKDCAQPPPKILISSVSEDRTSMTPRWRPAAARSWSSEDVLADSPHMEDISRSGTEDPKKSVSEVLSNSAINPSQLCHTPSPSSSTVPESVAGDSAINSPDSWVESEFGTMSEKIGESASDSSLCDSGAAWDVYRATPVEVTNSDEGFVPSGEDKTPDEQSITESYTDEGIYSLSSLESTQEQNQGRSDKKMQDEHYNQYKTVEQEPEIPREVDLDLVAHYKPVCPSGQPDEGPKEEPCAAQILTSSYADDLLKPDETNQSHLSPTNEPAPLKLFEEVTQPRLGNPDREPACLKNLVTLTEVGQDTVEQNNDQIESLLKTNNSEDDEVENQTDLILEEPRDWSEILNDPKEKLEDIPETTSEAIFCNCTETSKALANTCPSTQEVATNPRLEQGLETRVPQISISSEPEEQIKMETCDLERQADEKVARSETTDTAASSCTKSEEMTGDEKALIDINFCMIPESLQTTQNEDVEHSDEVDDGNCSTVDTSVPADKRDISEDQQQCELVHNTDDTDKDVTAQTEADETITGDTFCLNDGENTQQSKDSFTSDSDGTTGTLCYEAVSVSRNMDLFYADRSSPTEDIDGEPVEPMDLFYPDKEELVSTEPFDTDMQSWPSVLSVSALEPAPAAAALDEQPLLVEDLWNQEHDKVSSEEPERWSGQRMGGRSDVCDVAEAAPQSLGCSSAASEPVRPDGSAVPPVLRHRKGPRFTPPTDGPTAEAAETWEAGGADSECGDSWELYLLLLLWMLLYSVWLLPQMDLKTLPGLLLNLQP